MVTFAGALMGYPQIEISHHLSPLMGGHVYLFFSSEKSKGFLSWGDTLSFSRYLSTTTRGLVIRS